ncbi:hypothetical protein NPIL_199741 [Nephila pilipes]|uniref:Uncharacterized protein n=1 Tax=Nephila pilipes TaxID=299642 RepID=A0A8X6NTA7_NEPPI|nr:hypothetical protein NPIL_199741 [Nephila pilipes]
MSYFLCKEDKKKKVQKKRVIAPLSSQGQALSVEDAINAIVKRSVCLRSSLCRKTQCGRDWTSVICMTKQPQCRCVHL